MVKQLKNRFWQQQDWEEQIWRIIGFTNIARITILFTLMIFAVFATQLSSVLNVETGQIPHLLLALRGIQIKVWFAVYGVLVLLGIFYPQWQKQNRWETPNAAAVVDITMMVVLMHFLGGVGTGFGILVLPFLSVSCLLSYGRYALLYASYAASLILLSVFVVQDVQFDDMYQHMGLLANLVLLISGCYLVTLLTSFSARYLTRASESIERHRTAYERISVLNQVVLNRMQEAVIVVDEKRKVWLHNHQASLYFPSLQVNQPATFVQELVRLWRGNANQILETNFMINGVDMNVRGLPVKQDASELLILFIRAEKDRQAEAQSIKLASLGLLTANLAHEIRNPLSAMRQANGLLIENNAEDAISAKLCTMIDNNIARIDKMIEEVSQLNKSDRVKKSNIALSAFLKNFIQEFIMTCPEAKNCLKVKVGGREEVLFDPMHLQQIVWNLCNNAWRHCSKKASNAITITVQTSGHDHVSLRVKDDGAGVPANIQAHLFEPFFSTQTNAGGTGLGLYVARELAHANKGDLRYIPDKQAFEIILPKAHYDKK